MKQKALSLLLALAMMLSLAACTQTTPQASPSASGSPEPSVSQTPSAQPSEESAAGTVQFTDSCGRTVELPAQIDRIAPSGPMAQIVLFALCPDKFVGLASEWDPGSEA